MEKQQKIEQKMVELGVLKNNQFPVNRATPFHDCVTPYQDCTTPCQNFVPQQYQLKNQQEPIKNQQSQRSCNAFSGSNQSNSFSVQPLSEKVVTAKQELEILVATGKTKDLIGKQLTFQELDYMSEKELMKFYAIYQQNMAARVNDAVSKLFISGYSKLVSYFLPIENKDKLYDDLRNDYVLMNEIDRWVGFFSIKAGSLMALGTTGLITFNNCSIINSQHRETVYQDDRTREHEGDRKSNGERDKTETNQKEE